MNSSPVCRRAAQRPARRRPSRLPLSALALAVALLAAFLVASSALAGPTEGASPAVAAPAPIAAEEPTPEVEAPGAEAPETVEPEAEAPEAEAPEAVEPEAEAPEADAPETVEPEAEAPEAEAPETVEPEAEAPEAEAPETVEPEAEAPEAEAAETVEPEAEAPEAVEPEAEAPEAVEPEAVEPEAEAPEAVEPETVEPETVEPETVEPEAEAPEAEAPEAVKPEPVKPEPEAPEPVKPEPVKPEPVKPEPEAPSVEVMKRADGRMTLNLPGTPLGAFLKLISQASGMKLLAEADLSTLQLSIYLPDVTPKEALDAVCAAYGLAYEAQPGSDVHVLRRSSAAFFTLEHASAQSVQTLAGTLAGDGAQVAYDEEANVLAVYGGTAGIQRIRAMVQALDAPPQQVLIEATLAELTDDAQRDLGITWGDEAGQFLAIQGGARETSFPFDLKVHDWTYGAVSFQNFLIRLQALEQEGKANVLANPRIAAIHGKEAKIEIITRTVIGVQRTLDSEAATRVTEEPIFADVGIILTTTPRVHPDGRITLKVEPSVSSSARSPFFPDAVDTFNRQASTTLIMEDGQTVAIGGLRRSDTQESVRRVPVLGRIPGLGLLFTRKSTSTRNLELVVFLTPRLLTNERIAEDVAEQRRRVRSEVPLRPARDVNK